MKLDLSAVTLLMIETQCHKLARMAIDDCLKVAEFGDIIVASDNFNILRIPGAQHIRVENWSHKIGYCRCLWNDISRYVKTPQCLIIQWDSWIINPLAWQEQFLSYDYIGSPWRYNDNMNVGNSGFSLRSKKLMDFLYNNREKYPCTSSQEDNLVSRKYQPDIIKDDPSIRWAPEKVAHEFSFEINQQCLEPFGYHGIFNWPKVLNHEAYHERLEIARESRYVTRLDHHWSFMFQEGLHAYGDLTPSLIVEDVNNGQS